MKFYKWQRKDRKWWFKPLYRILSLLEAIINFILLPTPWGCDLIMPFHEWYMRKVIIPVKRREQEEKRRVQERCSQEN